MLQLDDALVRELHAAGFEIAVETNGTRPVPTGIDWLTVSPKQGPVIAEGSISGSEQLMKKLKTAEAVKLLLFEGPILFRRQPVCKKNVFLQSPIVYGKQPSRRSESTLRTQRHIRGPRRRGRGSRIPLDRSHVELHLAAGVYLPLWCRRLNRGRLGLGFGRLSAQ